MRQDIHIDLSNLRIGWSSKETRLCSHCGGNIFESQSVLTVESVDGKRVLKFHDYCAATRITSSPEMCGAE